MKKADRVLRYLCNYIIDNELKLNDPEEDEYGQCISEVRLSEVLEGTNIDVAKLTVEEVSAIADLGEFFVFRNNNEETEDYYGTIHHFKVQIGIDDVFIEIWDGY